jgi:hypothetical protein
MKNSTIIGIVDIDNKKMFIIACEPSMTDPDTQCVVANLEMR